ncbi:hypothetical protein CDAR_96581 [Caerostris darwini]|uniref:Uncharacterized protein n=1 Tax=Caerostris darwini TaxID=1538125 RepID=A0AAV4QY74_9ARAC|nr:hypothetical protein CDAR_96581 [Caerostris darwini]
MIWATGTDFNVCTPFRARVHLIKQPPERTGAGTSFVSPPLHPSPPLTRGTTPHAHAFSFGVREVSHSIFNAATNLTFKILTNYIVGGIFSHGHRTEQDDPEECRCAVCQEEKRADDLWNVPRGEWTAGEWLMILNGDQTTTCHSRKLIPSQGLLMVFVCERSLSFRR